MGYEYSGDAHRELVESYRADESPFPTDTSRNYPRRDSLRDEPPLLKQLLFPQCWNATELLDDPDETRARLTELGICIHKGITAYSGHDADDLTATVDRTLDQLPAIRRPLKKDVEAAYKGDPAAKSYCEIIRSYPGFHAILTHRVAHILYEEDRFKYARELAEYSKVETGTTSIQVRRSASISSSITGPGSSSARRRRSATGSGSTRTSLSAPSTSRRRRARTICWRRTTSAIPTSAITSSSAPEATYLGR